MDWIAVPGRNAADRWEARLKDWIIEYMKVICAEAHGLPVIVCTAVMEYPITQDTTHWSPLDDNTSLNRYALLLYFFFLAILYSINNQERIDHLALLPEDTTRARTLLNALNDSQEPKIHLIHAVFLPLCYIRKPTGNIIAPYKWNNPLECLITIHALQEKGQFIDPSLATPIFTQLKYHIRGAILYEGLRTMSKHDNDPLESFKAIAKQTIKVGTNTPFNAIRIYQKYATALAMSRHLLSICAWQQGLIQALEETEAAVKEILLGLDINIQISRKDGDNWSDVKTPGYSWTEHSHLKAKFKNILMKHYIEHGNIFIAFEMEILRQLGEINQRICMLVYFLPGGNSRISEHGDHKPVNGNRSRTVFRDGDDIWFAIRRTKTENRTQMDTFIPTKCPPRLSRLIETLQLVLRPFETTLVQHLFGEEACLITKQFFWEFLPGYCDINVGAQEYRQLYVEICRVFVGSELESFLDGDDVSDDDVGIRQQSHSAAVARTHYAVEEGCLPSMTSQMLRQFGRISDMFCEVWGGKEGKPARQPIRTRQNIIQEVASTLSNSLNANSNLSEAAIVRIVSATLSHLHAQWAQELSTSIKKNIVDSLIDLGLANPQTVPVPYSGKLGAASQRSDTPSNEDTIIEPSISLQQDLTLLTLNHLQLELQQSTSNCLQREFQQSTALQSAVTPSPSNAQVPQVCSDIFLLALLQKHFPRIENPIFKSAAQTKMVRMSLERIQNFVAVMSTGGGKSLSWVLPA
ncbi:hypothetical protein M422DRAFT_266500 [Sphaerobolus stellatus SS14]|uniref:Uncharacterized protein n=1 Tax=Sphaerobolus stellatus (strain SS14) TaxID=990650 RepID=A0A0C9V2K3_SPHS4|nr:hypothetical protein M422DRAFT_266500 [Sphaerobolus stellatus SS14]